MGGEGAEGPTFGRYRLLSLLGKGGTARVYRALRPGPMGFGKEVALKIIEPEASLGDEPMVSLANEARLGCLLRHPNIVTVGRMGRFGSSRRRSAAMVAAPW